MYCVMDGAWAVPFRCPTSSMGFFNGFKCVIYLWLMMVNLWKIYGKSVVNDGKRWLMITILYV